MNCIFVAGITSRLCGPLVQALISQYTVYALMPESNVTIFSDQICYVKSFADMEPDPLFILWFLPNYDRKLLEEYARYTQMLLVVDQEIEYIPHVTAVVTGFQLEVNGTVGWCEPDEETFNIFSPSELIVPQDHTFEWWNYQQYVTNQTTLVNFICGWINAPSKCGFSEGVKILRSKRKYSRIELRILAGYLDMPSKEAEENVAKDCLQVASFFNTIL